MLLVVTKSKGGCLRHFSLCPDLEVVPKDVSQALRLLHDSTLVFGDLREGNLLYLPNDGGRVLLINFIVLVATGWTSTLLALTLKQGMAWMGCRSWRSRTMLRIWRGL